MAAVVPVVGVSAEALHSLLPRGRERRSDVFILNLYGREEDADETKAGEKVASLFVRFFFFAVCVVVFTSGVMSVRRAGSALLCAMLAVTCARRSSPEQEDVQEKMNSARCTSRCLTLHMTQLTAAFRRLQVQTTIFALEPLLYRGFNPRITLSRATPHINEKSFLKRHRGKLDLCYLISKARLLWFDMRSKQFFDCQNILC